MRKLILVVILGGALVGCSGCATILGGIIGYQSRELGAGLAIGAAVDFGDDIARGVGKATANVDKEFRRKSSFNAQEGEIELPWIAFTPTRMDRIKPALRGKLEENGWGCKIVEKSARTGLFRKDVYTEKWRCSTAGGQAFELTVRSVQDKDTKLRVCVPEGSEADRAEVTSQIYEWLEEIAAEKQVS